MNPYKHKAWVMFSLVFAVYLTPVCADDFSVSKIPFIKNNKSENTISVNLKNADLSTLTKIFQYLFTTELII
jgi:hypothetical protein